jgi:hypothetical protein
MVKSGYAESLEVGGGGSAACIDAGMRISGFGRSDHDTPHVANCNFCSINNDVCGPDRTGHTPDSGKR